MLLNVSMVLFIKRMRSNVKLITFQRVGSRCTQGKGGATSNSHYAEINISTRSIVQYALLGKI